MAWELEGCLTVYMMKTCRKLVSGKTHFRGVFFTPRKLAKSSNGLICPKLKTNLKCSCLNIHVYSFVFQEAERL